MYIILYHLSTLPKHHNAPFDFALTEAVLFSPYIKLNSPNDEPVFIIYVIKLKLMNKKLLSL